MNHLETEEDRKDRWYAKNIVPEFVDVRSVTLEEMRREVGDGSDTTRTDENLADDRHLPIHVPTSIPGIPSSLLHFKESRKFLQNHLHRYGFAVIRNVLDESECNHALTLAWDFIEEASVAEMEFQESTNNKQSYERTTCTGCCDSQEASAEHKHKHIRPPVRRGEVDTYTSKYFPRSLEGNIFPFYGSGHSSFMWYLRSQSMVQEVFAVIHNVKRDELITSLDGFVLWTNEDGKRDRGWFHVDQSPRMKPNFSSIQGLVNLLPVTKEIGGNTLVSCSHRFFPENYLQSDPTLFYKDRLNELGDEDWLEIDPNDDVLRLGRVVMCLLDPGDVLIWDSRTIHCSFREQSERSELVEFDSQHGLVRAAGLVNMVPRGECSRKIYNERIEAVLSARTLTHWVGKASPLGEERDEDVKKERLCSQYMKENGQKVLLSYEDLSNLQRNLL